MNERLKQLRKTKGLTQHEFASRLGVATGNIGNWEIGKYPIPRARIYQICHEFGVREEWLKTGNGEMFEPDATDDDKFLAAIKTLIDALPEDKRELCLKAAREMVVNPHGCNQINGFVNVNPKIEVNN